MTNDAYQLRCQNSHHRNLKCTCLWILSGCGNERRCTLDTVATSTTILLYVSWMVSPSSTGVSWNLQRMLFPTRFTSRLCSTNSRTSWHIRLSTTKQPYNYTILVAKNSYKSREIILKLSLTHWKTNYVVQGLHRFSDLKKCTALAESEGLQIIFCHLASQLRTFYVHCVMHYIICWNVFCKVCAYLIILSASKQVTKQEICCKVRMLSNFMNDYDHHCITLNQIMRQGHREN